MAMFSSYVSLPEGNAWWKWNLQYDLNSGRRVDAVSSAAREFNLSGSDYGFVPENWAPFKGIQLAKVESWT